MEIPYKYKTIACLLVPKCLRRRNICDENQILIWYFLYRWKLDERHSSEQIRGFETLWIFFFIRIFILYNYLSLLDQNFSCAIYWMFGFYGLFPFNGKRHFKEHVCFENEKNAENFIVSFLSFYILSKIKYLN